MVANTPGYGNDEVADHTLMLLFALTRRLIPQVDAMRAAATDGDVRRRLDAPALHADPAYPRPDARHHRTGPHRQDGRRKAQGLGLKVVANDPYVPKRSLPSSACRSSPLDELLRASDYVTLHTPLTHETYKMIKTPQLSLMKPSAYLINCARGAASTWRRS